MTKPPAQRGKLTHDHELLVISRVFDLIATLQRDRREFVLDYMRARLDDMPVIAQVGAAADVDLELQFVRSGQAAQ